MPGPNDPYSNFIPMQAYMNANPGSDKEFNTAMSNEMNGDYSGKYDRKDGTGKDMSFDQFMDSQSGKGTETQGMSEIDRSLFGAGHATSGEYEPGKGKKKNEPDPDNPMPRTDTGAPAGKGAPRGKFPGAGGAGAADDQNNVYDNTANFNPMMAQMKMAQMGMGGGY